jgi:predicted dithiol-disulfide oxidoreductase (DUF899 family)
MADEPKLEPAADMAARNPIRHPGESPEYRAARQALLVEEIELRRQLERVARHRRALPPGAEVTKTYRFAGERGPITLEEMFGEHDTLIAYSYMFGPQRKHPCPMCTSFMNTWELKLENVEKNAAMVFIARSPIERLVATKLELGWKNLPVFSDTAGDYTREWVSPEDADVPGLNVFRREGGKIRHFWSGEMTESDPGQDPRGAPDPDPLWTLLDLTPAGRRADWYPSLDFPGRG